MKSILGYKMYRIQIRIQGGEYVERADGAYEFQKIGEPLEGWRTVSNKDNPAPRLSSRLSLVCSTLKASIFEEIKRQEEER